MVGAPLPLDRLWRAPSAVSDTQPPADARPGVDDRPAHGLRLR